MKTQDSSCPFSRNLIRSSELLKGFFMGRFLLVTIGVVLASIGVASAQTVTTDPVGFVQPFSTMPNQINCLANSDTLVSIPFTRPIAFTGAIASISGNVITVVGTPGWTTSPQQFVYAQGTQSNHYYALIGPSSTSDSKEGHSYMITGNGSNTITVDTTSDDLGGIPANTQVLIIPYSTFNTVFPASDANVSYIPSSNQFNRLTQIFLPNFSGSGINLSAAATYYYLNGAWRKFGQPTTVDHGDDILVPSGYFTVRNASTGTTLTLLGAVLTKKETIPLLTSTSTQVDNFVSVTRPVDVSLDNLGLISSGVFASSPNQFNRVDQLFVFDSTTASINKSASATYFYSNGAWRKFGQSISTNFGTDTIPAGAGFVIRKGITANGSAQFWQNAPTY
jgi:uncharacterized protein (TIGR02597 family)